jgi:hypothetical protein
MIPGGGGIKLLEADADDEPSGKLPVVTDIGGCFLGKRITSGANDSGESIISSLNTLGSVS